MCNFPLIFFFLCVLQNGIDLPEELQNVTKTVTTSLPASATGQSHTTLSQLFHDLNTLSQEVSRNVRYAVNKCKLDAVFERIVDGNENNPRQNGIKTSPAVLGSLSTGYIHNGYVETET